MKKVLIGICSIITIVFLVSWLHIEQTEWGFKEKQYNLGVPLKIANGTIVEIEEQVKKVIPNEYSTSHLREIKFISKSKEGFETFKDGELEFVYCDNLGNLNGFYEYDRFVLCRINVDLQQKLIKKMTVYGSKQIGGLKKLEIYPDIKEIREAICTYCENNTLFVGGYTIIGCFFDILNMDTIMSSFTVKLPNESQKQIYGKIVKFDGKFMFLEHK